MDGNTRKEAVVAGEGSTVPLDPDTLADRAAEALPPGPRAYLFGGAESEGTMGENRRAFDRWRIRPRVLRDVSTRDHAVSVGDQRLPHPVLFAPVGLQSMFHEDGETATARAAAETGTALCLSTVSSTPLEEVAEAHDAAADGAEPGPRWFQVYWSGREVTASMVRRAERAGYTALVLTVDAPVTGWRVRELASGYTPLAHGHGFGNYVSDPVFRERYDIDDATDDDRVVGAVKECFGDPSLGWEDVAWLRDQTDLPVYVKGVCHPADAGRAANVADGVVVSNHGGRQVDGELAALDALGPVVETVDGRVPVLFDSGVRTGADVFRALALGADAVLVGRPYIYGLALAGADGAADVVRNLRAAFDLTLELTGYDAAAAVDRDAVVRVD